MYFLSHAKEDGGTLHTIINYLNKNNLAPYWVDEDKITDNTKVLKRINDGLEQSTHFILIWSKHAKESSWVSDELHAAYGEHSKNNISMIILTLDNTPLPPIHSSLFRRDISTNIENVLDDVFKLNFMVQLSAYKKKIIKHYENTPTHPDKPIILNFRKLESGKNYFVKQQFENMKTQKKGNNIHKEIMMLIDRYSKELKTKNKCRDDILGIEQKISKLNLSNSILNKLVNTNDATMARNIIFENENLSSKIINDMGKLELMKKKCARLKTAEDTINNYNHMREQYDNNDKFIADLKDEYLKCQNDLSDISDQALVEKQSNLSKIKSNIRHAEAKMQSIDRIITNSTVKFNNAIKFKRDNKNICDEYSTIKSKINGYKTKFSIQFRNASKTQSQFSKYTKFHNELDTLNDELKHLEKEKLIPIIGDYGSGKSALANHLIYSIVKIADDDIVPIFVPLGDLPKHTEQYGNLLHDIHKYICKEYKFNISIDEFNNIIKNKKMIFILDALDEMSYKLDAKIGQNNLNRLIHLAKNSVVIFTSRHTYLSGNMQKELFRYDSSLKIMDFTDIEIERFLNFRLKNNKTYVEKITTFIFDSNTTLAELARKPLFLHVIYTNFDKIQNYKFINESIILTILTNEWIQHDSKIRNSDQDKKKSLMKSRLQISKFLAFAKKDVNSPITLEDIKIMLEKDFSKIDPDIDEQLEEYYKDAISSTFLVKEENESFRFILNPIREFFIARQIVDVIDDDDEKSLLWQMKYIVSDETFDFIKGLIDDKWAIKQHQMNTIENSEIIKSSNNSKNMIDFLHKFKNKSYVILNLIKYIQNKNDTDTNCSNLLKILIITKNLPPYTDLSHLNFSDSKLTNATLIGADLTSSNFSKCNLTGSNLYRANLSDTNLNECVLNGSNLDSAYLKNTKLTNAKLIGVNLKYTNLEKIKFIQTNLTNSDLRYAKFDNIIFNKTNCTQIKFGIDMTNMKFIECIFHNVILKNILLCDSDLRKSDFNNCDLTCADLTNCNLEYTKFFNCNLKHANLHKTKSSYADFYKTKLDTVDLSESTMIGVSNSSLSAADIHTQRIIT